MSSSQSQPLPNNVLIALEQADIQHLVRQVEAYGHLLHSSDGATGTTTTPVTIERLPEAAGGGVGGTILLSNNAAFGQKLNRVMGLGLTSNTNTATAEATTAALERIEELFRAAGPDVRPCIMLPSFVDAALQETLSRRGYIHDGTVVVFYIDLDATRPERPPPQRESEFEGKHEHEHEHSSTLSPPPPSTGGLHFHMTKVAPATADLFINTSLEGFTSGGRPPILLKTLAQLALRRPDTTLWLAHLEEDGQLAGSCGMAVLDSDSDSDDDDGTKIAQLYIDSTVPEFRGRGLHRAMIRERVRIARDEVECRYVMLLAREGSGSARNAGAVGFRTGYERAIWVKGLLTGGENGCCACPCVFFRN